MGLGFLGKKIEISISKESAPLYLFFYQNSKSQSKLTLIRILFGRIGKPVGSYSQRKSVFGLFTKDMRNGRQTARLSLNWNRRILYPLNYYHNLNFIKVIWS